MKVFAVSQDIFRTTGGAWDGTVGPLVNLWGFGNAKDTPKIPSDDQIRNIVGLVGFDKISVVEGHCLKKAADGLVLDLGSIAKGYGVDVVCDTLKKNGIENYLVEIGGEVRGSGKKIDHPWRVGINTPSFSAPLNQVCTQIELTDRAVATSGDYRNFKTENGKRYSHEIDPKTGRPVENNVASVSVIADTTVYADGLATGLMILGAEKGVALVNTLGNVACLFIVRDEKGAFKMIPSDRWPVKNPEKS
jgi:thiamine biosynthesis lipoprotein